jgi:cobyrinic acid a,c-diamide synthase
MILLGFDLEEFDLPAEYGINISFEEQLSVSTQGAVAVLDILRSAGVKATFYCTANYAIHRPEVISQIVNEGHEIASHGFYHSEFHAGASIAVQIETGRIIRNAGKRLSDAQDDAGTTYMN